MRSSSKTPVSGSTESSTPWQPKVHFATGFLLWLVSGSRKSRPGGTKVVAAATGPPMVCPSGNW
jgi:hypothetical protein